MQEPLIASAMARPLSFNPLVLGVSDAGSAWALPVAMGAGFQSPRPRGVRCRSILSTQPCANTLSFNPLVLGVSDAGYEASA